MTVGQWSLPGLALIVLAASVVAAPDLTLDKWRKYQDLLFEQGEKDRLRSEFRDLAAKDETALHRYLLGRAYGKLLDLDKARAEFERALEIDPRFGPACHGLALCLLQKGEVESAIEKLTWATTIDPDDDRSTLLLAGILADANRRDEAIRRVTKLLEKRPDHVDARLLLGRMYMQSRRFENARDELKAVLYHAPDHLGARKGLALCHTMLQDWKAAEAELRKILETKPEDFEVNLMLIDVLLRTRRTKEARVVLQGLLARKPPPRLEERLRAILRQVDQEEGGLGDVKTVEDLLGRLDDPDVEVRRRAVRSLARFQFSRLPPAVLRRIVDEDVEIRVRVVRMIGATGDEASVPLLALKLRHPRDRDESFLVRGACAEALEKIPSPAGVAVLLTVLDDADAYVVELALKALRTISGVRFVEAGPAEAVKDPAAIRRAWWGWWKSSQASARKRKAIQAIARIGSRSLVPYVIPLLDDADPTVFRDALAALTKVTGKGFGEVKDDPADRARVAKEAREWWKAGGR